MNITVYLGPTMALKGFSISTGTIYAGKATAEIEAKKEAEPKFAALFIKSANIAKSRRELQDANSALSLFYQDVYADYIAQKGSK